MIEPFIEVNLLDNADELSEFFEEHGYDGEEVYATIVEEEMNNEDYTSFEGYAAEFRLYSDDELIAVTTTWANKQELLNFVRDTLGGDFPIK